jgi:Excreted virulence factor EspC, type VII ESX diderm
MPRFDVDTGQLRYAGGRQATLGDGLLEACAQLEAAGAEAAGAAGDGRVAGAVQALAGGWANSLALLGGAVTALATNVDAAASAYEGTDEHAVPRRR